jgi:hypothetical protein
VKKPRKKNPLAQAMAMLRWRGVTEEERKAFGRRLTEARKRKSLLKGEK